MAKTDPILGGSVESPPEKAPLVRGGTIRLPSADARSSKRKTEPMLGPGGLLRDTVRDLLPPGAMPEPSVVGELSPAVLSPAVLSPAELSSGPPRGQATVASDRKVSLEGFVPRSAVPEGVAGPKVDVSRVDPRRAPTQKIQRRPPGELEPGLEADGFASAGRAEALAIAPRRARGVDAMWVVFTVLLVGAVALVGALAWRLSGSSAVPRGSEGSVK